MAELSVVILNWKVRDLLRRCLTSVYRETKGSEMEVIVVDNASDDGSAEMIMRDFPSATLIAHTRNRGFSAGNNPAIAHSTGEFIVLLNPDTELESDALSSMVAYLREHPKVGVCGPKLIGADGELQPSVRALPTLLSQVLIMLKLHHVFRGLPSLRHYFADSFDYGRTQTAEQVMGAVFMMRRAALEEVGLLDERFFIWFEEVDMCKRMRDAGWDVRYFSGASVRHFGGESFGQVFGPTKQRMFDKSLRSYFRKHHGFAAWLTLLFFHPLAMTLAWLATLSFRRR